MNKKNKFSTRKKFTKLCHVIYSKNLYEEEKRAILIIIAVRLIV